MSYKELTKLIINGSVTSSCTYYDGGYHVFTIRCDTGSAPRYLCHFVGNIPLYWFKKEKNKDYSDSSLDSLPDPVQEESLAISRDNMAITPIVHKQDTVQGKPYVVIVQRNSEEFRVEKSKLLELKIPEGESDTLHFVALKQQKEGQREVWYLVEERKGKLYILALADEFRPGLVTAFKLVAYIGKNPNYTLRPQDRALLKNFGWGIEDVKTLSPNKHP